MLRQNRQKRWSKFTNMMSVLVGRFGGRGVGGFSLLVWVALGFGFKASAVWLLLDLHQAFGVS